MVEYLDLYDQNRIKTGKIHKRGEPIEYGYYIIVVNVWIVNSENEVLLTQRHPLRKIWGGLWECSASGAVLSGEDSLQGALREAEEEIGVILLPSEAILLESIIRKDNFRDTFLFKKDIPISEIKIQPEEVINVKWVDKQEYNNMCRQELLAPPVKNFWQLYFPLQIAND